MKYLIGNWKSNKSESEVKKWFFTFHKLYLHQNLNCLSLEIVICPSFIHLSLAKQLILDYRLPIKLGAQNVSPYEVGAYTGEVAASQLKEVVEYVIIGHSERRNYFKEENIILEKKVEQIIKNNLHPIYCISDANCSIPEEVKIVAYEPIWAIGTGKADSPLNANKIIKKIKKMKSARKVIYGGSVTPKNITSFISKDSIDGVLPGGASLKPEIFLEMIINAAKI